MGDLPLLPVEEAVLSDALDGRETVLGDADGAVRAVVLRSILLGRWKALRSARGVELGDAAVARLCIRGARIHGALDLQGALGPPGADACPALLLRDCRFVGLPASAASDLRAEPTVDLRNARMARVELIDCEAQYVALDGARVGGDIDLSGLHSAAPALLGRVSARNLRCDASFSAERARLNLQPSAPPEPNAAAPFALDLRDAQIAGNLLLGNGFRALGGVHLPKTVGGDVWMLGARILRANANQNHALRGPQCHVHGSFALRPVAIPPRIWRSYVRGPVDLFGLRVDGTLDLSGADLVGDGHASANRRRGVYMPYVVVGGGLMLGEWMSPDGAYTRTPLCDTDLNLSNARVGAQTLLWLRSVSDVGPVRLDSARLEGGLVVHSARPKLELHASDLRASNLYLGGRFELVNIAGAELGGQVNSWSDRYVAARFNAFEARVQGAAHFVVEEALDIHGAEFSGQLSVVSQAAAPGAVLRAGSLAAARGIAIEGRWDSADMSHAKVVGDLNLGTVACSKADLDRAEITGDLLSPKHLFGKLSIRGARIGGSLRLGEMKLHVRKRANAFTRPSVSLADCTIAGDLGVLGLQRVPEQGANEEVAQAPQWLHEQEQTQQAALYTRKLSWHAGSRVVEAHRRLPPTTAGASARVEATAFLFVAGAAAPKVLSGESAVIHEQVLSGAGPQLTSADSALDYLSFFCGYVWADDGAFKILAPADDSEWYQPQERSDRYAAAPTADDDGERWKCEATVAYGDHAFRAVFTIAKGGQVEMTSDEALTGFIGRRLWFNKPHREYEVTADVPARHWLYGDDRDWRLVSDPSERAELLAQIGGALTTTEARHVDSPDYDDLARVDLQGCSCGTLDDDHGEGWKPGVRADLRAFVYQNLGERIGLRQLLSSADVAGAGRDDLHGRELARKRIGWLTRLTGTDGFSVQPIEQLYGALRRRGDEDAATEVLVHKLRVVRTRRSWLPRLSVYWLVEWPFLYGLSSWRAIGSSLLFLALGALAFDVANYGRLRLLPLGTGGGSAFPNIPLGDQPMLVIDSQSVSLLMAQRDGGLKPVHITSVADAMQADEVQCGDQVESVLYALDVMLPLVDLRQEGKCTISSRDTVGATAWRAFKSLYSIAGAYVSSMLILTLSGILRRNVER